MDDGIGRVPARRVASRTGAWTGLAVGVAALVAASWWWATREAAPTVGVGVGVDVVRRGRGGATATEVTASGLLHPLPRHAALDHVLPVASRTEVAVEPAARSPVVRESGEALAICVTTPTGRPVAGAKVRLYPKELRGPADLECFDPVAFRVDRAEALELTDDEGRATWPHGVEADSYVCVEAAGHPLCGGTVTKGEAEAGLSSFPLSASGTIELRVIDGRTKAAIAGATLLLGTRWKGPMAERESIGHSLRALTARRATTDRDGRARFALVDRDVAFALWVFAAGYPPRSYHPVHPSAIEQLVRLHGGAPRAGRVVDEEGRGLSGATIKSAVMGLDPGHELGDVTSRDDGTFELAAVPDLPLFFLVNRMGYAFEGRYVMEPLGDGPLEFVLRREAKLSGVVVDDLGRPIAGAFLEFVAAEASSNPGNFTTYDDGTFDMPWLDPRHTQMIEARATGHTPRRLAGIAPKEGLRLVLDRRGSVRGRVVDVAGAPVTSFQVAWLPTRHDLLWEHEARETLPWRDVVSDDGSFELADVEAGEVELLFAAPGRERPEPQLVVVPAGGAAGPLQVELAAARTIAGRVVTPDGTPIAGATVSWLFESSQGEPSGRATPTRCDTDRTGAFELSGLPDRPFTLRVTDNVRPNASYPDLRVADFPRELVFAPTATIEGRLRLPWSSPESAVSLLARLEGTRTWSSIDVAPDGTFRWSRIPAGRWLLEVDDYWGGRAASAQESRPQRRVDVAQGGTAHVEFDLTEQGRIVGFVTAPTGAPALDHVEVLLFAADAAGARVGDPLARAGCEADGRFVLFALAPGRHVAQAVMRRAGWGASCEAGVAIAAGGTTVDLRLALGEPTMEGSVVDGDGRPIAADVEVVAEPRAAPLFTVHADRAGRWRIAPPRDAPFRLRLSAPGFARPESDAIDPAALPDAPLETLLEPEARVAIRVRDEAGAAIADAEVVLEELHAVDPWPWRGCTAVDGTVVATRLPAGAWRVEARAADRRAAAPAVVDLEWGETRALTLTLAATGRARLCCVDGDGVPLAAVEVTLERADDPARVRMVTSDAAGQALAVALPAGRWLARAAAAEAVALEVAGGGEATATLVVRAPRR